MITPSLTGGLQRVRDNLATSEGRTYLCEENNNRLRCISFRNGVSFAKGVSVRSNVDSFQEGFNFCLIVHNSAIARPFRKDAASNETVMPYRAKDVPAAADLLVTCVLLRREYDSFDSEFLAKRYFLVVRMVFLS